jgi:histidyl-tRNA synthetase
MIPKTSKNNNMKPSIPKGTRDFLPHEVVCRQYIFDTLKSVFELYDFAPIETPAIENLQTLTGKYGEEGDRLLFKILNNGDFLNKVDPSTLKDGDSYALLPQISKRGLRYDLTVPLARYVVMHQNDLTFPFKRYQIQPVWRADRPQKGRYQEFYQCDVDIIGSDALLYEAELLKIYDIAFHRLNVPVMIKLNNRKILQGIAEVAGCQDNFQQFTIILDKLDKIGKEGVRKEFLETGISDVQITLVFKLIKSQDIEYLKEQLNHSKIGSQGVTEIEKVKHYLGTKKFHNDLKFDWSLARGLNYYTGCIFEVICPSVSIGSIGGGGRYDDLTGIFGMPGMSGVGISFGAARIYDVMTELDVFPKDIRQRTKIILMAFDEVSHAYAFECVSKLREAGIPSSIYPEPTKLKKQMKYANDRGIPYVGLIGEEELAANALTFKNMQTGEQSKKSVEEIIELLH